VVNNWLITGGCGFIGTSLIKIILEQEPSTNIRILDNLSVGTKSDLEEVASFEEISEVVSGPQGIELLVGDIRDPEVCKIAAIGCDCIVHFAANTGVGPSVEDPRIDMEANVVGTFNMLDSARINCVRRFIFASSGAPVGELLDPPMHEELPAHPVSPYGASKLAGEGYCSAYYRSYGVGTVCLRFGNVYGPRSKNKSSVIAKFVKLAAEGKNCEIYGDGKQTRDFIYISDLVDAVIQASESTVGGETFQIATSEERTVIEVAVMIKEALKECGIVMSLVHGEVRLGDVLRNYSDTSKAKKYLGWEAKVSLKDGVRQTINYFMELEDNSKSIGNSTL